ncbi:MAG: alpha/beta fold hydrolase [Gammaproteobacteria bacterium]|nr:alpha/beta fold hydrolase [Gammaproteobacteria bacterium]
MINEAAGGVTGLSPLVGVRQDDLVDALKSTTVQALKQPLLAAKHSAGFASKMVDVLAGKSSYQVGRKDRRFNDDTWQENGLYKRLLQVYLALDESFDEWVTDLDLGASEERKARFVVDLLTDGVAPTNYLLTNPAALKKARATRGGSLVQGIRHALDDIRHNNKMPSQVDKSQFKVGDNLATTEGAVVFRNEVLELIQYQPKTARVQKIPMLVVPPQINKFYVFDLTPEKSMFKFIVEQGLQLFTVSWRNPTSEQRHWGLDEYLNALTEAVEAVQAITGQPKLNLMGACSGGITASILAGYLNAVGNDAINALTLMVCVLSQDRDDSDITVFANPRSIENARRSSQKKGILDGAELSRVFNWMRPNDLIWNYVVNNYLMGNKPPAFDILYWNNDTTNLPAQLHSDFLDQILTNPLATPGDLTVLDQPIDLSALDYDKYMLGGVTDHITPWHACYRSTQIMGGDIRFILSNSGHIQAMVNPPGNPKANYFSNDALPASHEEWLEGAQQHAGTWWDDWAGWLQQRSGKKVIARKTLGKRGAFEAMEAAPGTYVFGVSQ